MQAVRWQVSLLSAALLPLLALTSAVADPLPRFDGFNVVAMPGHPFGSASARRSLVEAHRLGATTVAVIPFLWQPRPQSKTIERGSDMPDPMLRTAIQEARAVGLRVLVKPHIWVPESWAGAIDPGGDEGWRSWFADYRAALLRIARIAAEEHADALAVGTELTKSVAQPEWRDLIGAVRAVFPGTLIYVAHDMAEAEAVPFWDVLDAIGISLYPPLAQSDDHAARLATMRATAVRLDALAARTDKPVIVAEIGLRSAVGATAKPWESAEEREAAADPLLQARVLADWFSVLDRPSIRGVMVWRWFTNPNAGGASDTDFTVQGKLAEGVLLCEWVTGCAKR
jgi:hypothetical protein